MDSKDKNKIMRNLRNYLSRADAALYEHQIEALKAAEAFLRMPVGKIFTQAGNESGEKGSKKGDFLEIVSATGTGKTRMLGTMAKAMDVPTLILTPRKLLNKQAKDEFCDEIGIPADKVAVYDSTQSAADRRRVLQDKPPPQFVITTYQSLPALLHRHELDVTNPADPHYRPLVILDEVHEAQGEKTAEILKGLSKKVLLAGFTATDAGASETLFDGQVPVFRLPLVPAIRKGLLCKHVKAAVIDVATDETLLQSFREAKGGKDYLREDVEEFAHSSLAIDAAVRFHLTKTDDTLGPLYRLPTIFYTHGVKAAEKGADEFNRMARELGVNAKAAYVSGDMDSGKVLEQFKKGEIQAVWNDRLLGMGFDNKNATVCYSLQPTRMEHVAEQQLGRVTRRQGADYRKRFGHDKTAIAINVRPLGLTPVTYAKILGAPSVSADDVAEAAITRSGSKAQPAVTSAGQQPSLPEGVKAYYAQNEMHELLSREEEERIKTLNLPPNPAHMLSLKEMAAKLDEGVGFMASFYQELQESWMKAKEGGKSHFSAKGTRLAVDQANIYGEGDRALFCINEKKADALRLPPKDSKKLLVMEGWDKSNGTLFEAQAVYKAMESAWLEAREKGQKNFEALGKTFSTMQAGYCRTETATPFFVDTDALYFPPIPQKTQEWLDVVDAAKIQRRRPSDVAPSYQVIKPAWEAAMAEGKKKFSALDMTLSSEDVGYFMNERKQRTFCLRRGVAEKVMATLPAKPEKFTEQVKGRPIAPGSKHVKGTGKGRGRGGDEGED